MSADLYSEQQAIYVELARRNIAYRGLAMVLGGRPPMADH